ncbi:unnamed protein product, partial [Ectocarpus sp. 12 AP-2014]
MLPVIRLPVRRPFRRGRSRSRSTGPCEHRPPRRDKKAPDPRQRASSPLASPVHGSGVHRWKEKWRFAAVAATTGPSPLFAVVAVCLTVRSWEVEERDERAGRSPDWGPLCTWCRPWPSALPTLVFATPSPTGAAPSPGRFLDVITSGTVATSSKRF